MSAQTHLLHARQLMRIGRWAPAADQLRLALADDPAEADAHALLALCLSRQHEHADARREADLAVRHAPESGYAHWIRAAVLIADDRHAEAETSAREALRIDPNDPDHHHALAACLLARDQAPAALAQVETGLAEDPEHAGLNDLRIALLQRLGRGREAEAAIAAALARDPDNADHHVNVGWARLRAGAAEPAAQHFSEALRLEPDNDQARVGLVEALKARYLLYRLFLAWVFWLMRLSPTVRWLIILGGYFAHSLAGRLADLHPGWSPWLTPLVWGYMGFAFLTWTAQPVFNLLLLAHPLGRHALHGRERTATLACGACLTAAAVGIAAYPLTGHAIGLLVAMQAALLTAVLYPALNERVARRRQILLPATLAYAAVAIVALALIGMERTFGVSLWNWGFFGWLALIFLPGFLAARGR